MDRFRKLGTLGKACLLILAIMLLVFSILYPRTISQKGFLYEDELLVQTQKNDVTTYTGTVYEQPVSFSITSDRVVTFKNGDEEFGPYTAVEDPSAIPREEEEEGYQLKGIELRCGEDVVFRGGITGIEAADDVFLVFNEDGTFNDIDPAVVSPNDEMDQTAPTTYDILRLMYKPALGHKGSWDWFIVGVVLSLFTAALILYADDLFYLSLRFRIRNADKAEASDWEIVSRYGSWVVLIFMIVIFFCRGLQAIG